LVRQRLLQIEAAQAFKQQDINAWLESYFVEKYGLPKFIDEDIEIEV